MGSVDVDLAMIGDEWNVAVSFPEKIYSGNVQVWNARFLRHSDDGRTLLFSSKSRHSKMGQLLLRQYLLQVNVKQIKSKFKLIP